MLLTKDWRHKCQISIVDLHVAKRMPFLFFSLHQNAVSRQCARMQLEVFDWNVKALRFYDGIGGKCTPEWLKIEMNRTALTAFASDIKN